MIARARHPTQGTVSERRISAVLIGMLVFGALLVLQLAYLQIVSADELRAESVRQHSTVRTLPATRGRIFYRERASETLYPLATNRTFSHLYAVPRDIQNVEATFDALWPLLEPTGIAEETLRIRLGKTNDIYEPLAHKLTDAELAAFQSLHLAGVGWEPETWRFYPEGETLGQVLGFVVIRDGGRVGLYGLDGVFDDDSSGAGGVLEGAVDVTGRLIQSGPSRIVESESGVDLILTIDRTIQAFACEKLRERVLEVEAASGQLVIVDPKTGAVMAMCTYPAYDPNNYSDVSDISVYLNPIVNLPYEPGSIFKPITMAGAIDAEVLTPETTYVDEGFVMVDGYRIKNFDGEGRGEVNMIKVLEDSLNTGAMYAQRLLGNQPFREYVEQFGFGRVTGIELSSEASGNISSLYKKSDVFFATPSFGQGITVTPLQMVMSYAAIANGGKLMKPYVVAEKRRGDEVVFSAAPEVVGETVSLRAATIVGGMLVSVVREGYDNRGGVPGYAIAGKTGTAQVAEGGVYGNRTVHSYAGFGPVDNPVFAGLVKFDYPQRGRFASSTTAPTFGEIAKFILHYYEIPPDES